MGFRLQRSIKITKGLRLNFSKSGVGLSVGPKGARFSVSPRGRVLTSVGLPGTGLSYRASSTLGSGVPRRSRASRAAQSRQPVIPQKPGLFAPKGEKELYRAVHSQDPHAIEAVGVAHPEYRGLAYAMAGLLSVKADQPAAKRLLGQAFDLGVDPATEEFVRKYMTTRVEVPIAHGVAAELPLTRDALGLALAELHQADGEALRAIQIVEQLEPTSFAALSLAELYSVINQPDEVIKLTEGLKNEDDATALLLAYRGVALRESGHPNAAVEAFKAAFISGAPS